LKSLSHVSQIRPHRLDAKSLASIKPPFASALVRIGLISIVVAPFQTVCVSILSYCGMGLAQRLRSWRDYAKTL